MSAPLCHACRQPVKSFGACPRCRGDDSSCEACVGHGEILVCACPPGQARIAPGPGRDPTNRSTAVPTEAPTVEELAERARARRGTVRRDVSYEHDFRQGRCTICGKLEMLARPNRWPCV